jgi:hypothetical protein
MTQNAQLSVTLSVNHQDATHPAKNQKMLSVTLNAKNQIAKSNAQIRLVKLKIAQNVSPSVNNQDVLPIAKPQNQNVKQFAKNQNVIGNATNQNAQNQNANSYAKTQDADQK